MNEERGTMYERTGRSGRVDEMKSKYARALADGAFPRARRASNEEVARRYQEGMELHMEAVAQVRSVLQDLGVNPMFYFRYVPFGGMLARFRRTYSGLTLENLARGLVREWELRLSRHDVAADPPDSVVLRAICERAFGIRFGQGSEGSRDTVSECRTKGDGRS